MRSLAAQLVALALAVPVSTVSSSNATAPPSQDHGLWTTPRRPRTRSTPIAARTARHACCGTRSGASTDAPSRWRAAPRCPCRRHRASAGTARRCACSSPHQARVLGRYRTQARRPLRLRLSRFAAWVCIHRHEARLERRGRSLLGRPADGSRLHARLRRRHDRAPPRRPRRHLDAGRADRRRRARLRDARVRALAEHVAQLRRALTRERQTSLTCTLLAPRDLAPDRGAVGTSPDRARARRRPGTWGRRRRSGGPAGRRGRARGNPRRRAGCRREAHSAAASSATNAPSGRATRSGRRTARAASQAVATRLVAAGLHWSGAVRCAGDRALPARSG